MRARLYEFLGRLFEFAQAPYAWTSVESVNRFIKSRKTMPRLVPSKTSDLNGRDTLQDSLNSADFVVCYVLLLVEARDSRVNVCVCAL